MFGGIVGESVLRVSDTVAITVTLEDRQRILNDVRLALTADRVRLDVEGLPTHVGTNGQIHAEVPYPIFRVREEGAKVAVAGPACWCRTKR